MSGCGIINESNVSLRAYLGGCVAFPVPDEAITAVLVDRDISDGCIPAADFDKKTRDLCKADLLKWICTSMTSTSGITDKDNSWEHSDKGYTLDSKTRSTLLAQANQIYDMYGEEKAQSGFFKIQNFGIKRANIPIPPVCTDV